MHRKNTPAGQVAVGGILAGLAVIVLSFGSLIPGMTYVCPVICVLLLEIVRLSCGHRIGWAWFGAVSVLGMLFCPDREASTLFLLVGYYPLLRPILQKMRAAWLLKILIFNLSIGISYFILLYLLGLPELTDDFASMGCLMLIVMVGLGNITFFVLDKLLGMIQQKWKRDG